MIDKGLKFLFQNLLVFLFILFFFYGQAFAEQPDISVIANSRGEIPKEIYNWKLSANTVKPDKIILTFSDKTNHRISVHLEKRDDAKNTFSKTASFNIFYKSETPLEQDFQQNIADLMLALTELIKANDKGQYNFSPAITVKEKDHGYFSSWGKIPVDHEIKISRQAYWYVDILERVIAIALFLASLIGIFFLAPLLSAKINRLTKKQKLWFVALLFGSLFIHLIVPHRLVMTYSGYGIMDQAMTFAKLKKYGAGTPFFYHFFYLFLPNTDKVYLWINTIAGWLTLVIASIWFAGYMKNTKLIFALLFLMAIDPIVLKDHNSESNFIPTLFFFFVALNWLEIYKVSRDKKSLLFSLVSFLFVIYSRPFFIIFVPLIVLIEQLTSETKLVTRKTLKQIATAILIACVVVLPHIVFLIVSYYLEMDTGHSEGFSRVFDAAIYKFFSDENVFVRFDMTPFMFIFLWSFSLLHLKKREKLKLISLFLLSFAMFCLYFIDSPPPSLPRLQMVPHYFFCMISAYGLVNIQKVIASRKNNPLFLSMVPAVILLSVYPATTFLWTPINDWEEDKALRESVLLIPETAKVLGRLAEKDEPHTFGIFRNYPDYLFKRKIPELKVLNLTNMLKALEQEDKQDIAAGYYVYLGTRCYALILDHETGRDFNGNVVDENYLHPGCKEIRDKFVLKPIYEIMAINHEMKSSFVWYTPNPKIKLGLYEIQAFKENN